MGPETIKLSRSGVVKSRWADKWEGSFFYHGKFSFVIGSFDTMEEATKYVDKADEHREALIALLEPLSQNTRRKAFEAYVQEHILPTKSVKAATFTGVSRATQLPDSKCKNIWAATVNILGQQFGIGHYADEQTAGEKYELAMSPTHLLALENIVRTVVISLRKNAVKQYIKEHIDTEAELKTSKYRGVNWNKLEGKWQCAIAIEGKTHSRQYLDEKLASEVYELWKSNEELLRSKPWPERVQLMQTLIEVHIGDRAQKKTSKYRGVSWNNGCKKWICALRVNGRLHALSFADELKASQVFELLKRNEDKLKEKEWDERKIMIQNLIDTHFPQ
jgi:hypothetical protein